MEVDHSGRSQAKWHYGTHVNQIEPRALAATAVFCQGNHNAASARGSVVACTNCKVSAIGRKPPGAIPSAFKGKLTLRVVILENSEAVTQFAADEVCALLNHRSSNGFGAVLGLATGGTPLGLYRELIARNARREISFANVETFNLDEYIGVPPDSPHSYHYYMQENLFKHIDIDASMTHVPVTWEVDLQQSAANFEQQIEQAGGIDLQILGIGADAHIGFNEIGSSLGSRTRVKTLTQRTRQDNARYFGSIDEVPQTALTMGIQTILESQLILLLATGSGKSKAIRETVEGPITASVPASALQLHPNVTIAIDRDAASGLTNADYFLVAERNRAVASRSS